MLEQAAISVRCVSLPPTRPNVASSLRYSLSFSRPGRRARGRRRQAVLARDAGDGSFAPSMNSSINWCSRLSIRSRRSGVALLVDEDLHLGHVEIEAAIAQPARGGTGAAISHRARIHRWEVREFVAPKRESARPVDPVWCSGEP